MSAREWLTRVVLFFGLLGVVAFGSTVVRWRIDLTADKRYTLGKASLRLLKKIEQPVTITAYFTRELPPNLLIVYNDVLDLLEEYHRRSGKKIVYEVVDPNKKQETEIEAQRTGIMPVLVSVREKDQLKQQKAYLGMVLKYKDRREVIPFVNPAISYEYQISLAIARLTTTAKKKIAYLTGNGEKPLSQLRQLVEQLTVLYEVEEVTLTDTSRLDNYAAIVWVDPTDSLSSGELSAVEQALRTGVGLCLIYDPLDASLQSRFINLLRNTSLEDWLSKWGIEVEGSVVVDAQAGTVLVQQQQGPFVLQVPVQFPYFPVATSFSEYPIVFGLEQVQFLFASPVRQVASRAGVSFQPLVFSSGLSGVENPPVFINLERQWTRADFPLQGLPLAALVIDSGVATTPIKMVIIGDAEIAGSELWGQGQLPPDNLNLVANAIDWLAESDGLTTLRTKVITARPLKQMDDTSKTLIKYGNVVGPIILVVLWALLHFQRRRQQRLQWQATRYSKIG